ncbi:MAG: hypothetical protein M3P30_04765 [Chloroflexota bacterium]|nr:hypothetical protein [Chloroflexota bacterium]
MKYSLTLDAHQNDLLTIGEYSTHRPPPARRVEIHATNRHLVKYTEKQYGTAEHYRLAYEVENRNDSPAFFEVVTEEPSP